MKNKAVSGIMVILFLTFTLSIGINQCQSIIEEWVPYVPFSQMVDLELWESSGIWHMDVSITFADSGYMISDWGTIVKNGYEFWVDCEIWDWTGYALFVITTISNTYDLGHLEEGSYTFTFKAWGIDVKGVSFTVPSDPASDPAPNLCIDAIVLVYAVPPIIPLPYIIHIYPPPEFPDVLVYKINATVTNQGTADTGSFNVSLSAFLEGEEVLELRRKNTTTGLEQGGAKSIQFDFDPYKYGNYTLILTADCDNDVSELDETNNVKTTWVIVTVRGDVDGDFDVDGTDFWMFAGVYPSDPALDPMADFDWDGDVDGADFWMFTGNYATL